MSLIGKSVTRTGAGCALLACLLASSCGGGGSGSSGGGSGSSAPPSQPGFQGLANDVLVVNFPFGHAAYSGSSVAVSGSLNHAEFAEMSVTVIAGDRRIPVFVDDHGNFLIPDVPLQTQPTGAPLVVMASHPQHGSTQRSFVLSRTPDLASLVDIEMDPRYDRVIAIDALTALVLSISLTDGRREILSGPSQGNGQDLSEPIDLVLDAANDRAFVLDDEKDAVFQVDLTTGGRSILYELQSFSGRIAFNPVDGTVALAEGYGSNFRLVMIDPVSRSHSVVLDGRMRNTLQLRRATAFALDIDYNRAILVNGESGTVYGIDLSTGAVRKITDRTFASVPRRDFFRDIELRDGTAYLVDSSGRAIVGLDLTTGRQEIISNPATFQGKRVGTGPLLLEPRGLALDGADDRLIIADEFVDALVAVDLQTGDRTSLTDGGVGAGIHFRSTTALAMTEDPVRLFAIDPISDTVVEIDPDTGDRRLIFGTGNTVGTIETTPSAIAVDPMQAVLYYGDSTIGALFEVDLAGGTPKIVSGETRGKGPLFGSFIDIELDSSGETAYILDRILNAVLAVDTDTGDRRIVSDATTGVGGHFRNPVGLQLDLENDRVFVSDADSRTIYEINVLSGDRIVVSGWRTGSGAAIRWLGDIAYDPRNQRIVAIDVNRRGLISIDLATGDGEIISGDTYLLFGGGAVFAQPRRIELSADHAIAYVLDSGYDGVLAVELHTGDRQLISK